MNLGEFKDLLRRAHKRGTSLDHELDGAIRRAARWIEANYTLQYMKQRVTLTVERGTDEVALPRIGIKAILFLRYRDLVDGEVMRISKSTLESFNHELMPPQEFYLDGATRLVFNGIFQEDAVLIGRIARFSDWPKKDTDTHWLLDNAESLLLTQSMLELGLISRDDRTYQTFLQHRSDQITVLQNADYEAEYAGQDIILGA